MRATARQNKHTISIQIVVNLQPLEFFSVVFQFNMGFDMAKKLRLTNVIEKFLDTHPGYIPDVHDVQACVKFANDNFMRVIWSTDGILSRFGREAAKYRDENEKLRQQIKSLHSPKVSLPDGVHILP